MGHLYHGYVCFFQQRVGVALFHRDVSIYQAAGQPCARRNIGRKYTKSSVENLLFNPLLLSPNQKPGTIFFSSAILLINHERTKQKLGIHPFSASTLWL